MDDRGFILDSDATAQDVYSTLHVNEIRTLLLAPGPKGSPIVCEMQVISSPRAGQYEALSYVWGDSVKSSPISCNGFGFAVTESLHDALVHLRYPDSWRRLWVDQLCINQSESTELMNQIGFMGNVYSSASRVIVWLGKYDKRMTMAWEILQQTTLSSSLVRSDFLASSRQPSTPQKRPPTSRRSSSNSSISKYSQRAPSSQESLRSSTSSVNSMTPTRPKSRRQDTPPALRNVLSIFQHVWFSRKWTFQEIVLAKAAIICCGELEMAWSDLTLWYFHYASKLRHSSILYDSQGFFENIMDVRNDLGKGTLRLSNLLMLTRPRMSTKSEDAVFALLGLVPELAKFLGSSSSTGLEDHGTPHSDILYKLYLTAFRFCLEQENDLAILSAAGMYKGNTQPDGWPTWLPDWRQQLPIRPLVLTEQPDLGPVTAFYDETFESAPTEPPAKRNTAYSLNVSRNALDHSTFIRPSLTIHGTRLGCIVSRAAAWPNAFFVTDTAAHSGLDRRTADTGEADFSQPIASLIPPTGASDLRKTSPAKDSTYSTKLIQGALKNGAICQSIRTSSMVETGDWLCALDGGPVLYALRPLQACDRLEQKRPDIRGGRGKTPRDSVSAPMGSLRPDPAKWAVQCLFIGECAVHGLRAMELLDTIGQRTEFELI